MDPRDISKITYGIPQAMNQTPIVPPSITTGMGPITDGFLNEVSARVSSAEFAHVAQKMCAPVREIAVQMIKPYVYAILIVHLLIIGLLFIIIWNTRSRRK